MACPAGISSRLQSVLMPWFTSNYGLDPDARGSLCADASPMPLLLTGRPTLGQRIALGVVWLTGLLLLAGLLVFGFFVGAVLLGIAAIAGLAGWLRWRLGKPAGPVAPRQARPAQPGGTVIDAEYVVIRREER